MASVFPSGSACKLLTRKVIACCLSLGVLLHGLASPRILRAQEPSPRAGPSAPGPGDIKNQCADAYEATQRERAAGHLLVARKNGIFCAQDSCPEVLRSDCAKWSDELASSVPSLVIEVRGPRADLLSNVYVEVDGAPFVDHLDGRALEIDPGRHHFRFQALGLAPSQLDVVLLEGRETQHLRVALAPEPVKPPPPRPVPLASYVLGGVGVLGAGGFAYFGLTGNHLKNELDQPPCRPACDKQKGDTIRRDWVVADVSLGVALVSLGVATWLAVANVAKKAPPPEQALHIRAGADGALLTFQREF